MNVQQIREKIEALHYWDSRVVKLSCDHFTDEVLLKYDDSEPEEKAEVIYNFTGCYKVEAVHSASYQKDKPYKELTYGQIPYFIQDIEIQEIEVESLGMYSFKIDMYPMQLEIWCTGIEISRNTI